MKLLAKIRLANANARNTRYAPVVVNADDGGEAQRKAMDIAGSHHPDMILSGGPVCNATPEAIAALEEECGMDALTSAKGKARARPAQQRGVKPHPLDEENENA